MRLSLLRLSRVAALATLLAALSAGAAPIELAGVKIDDHLDLQGTPLVLNGAGIRYKTIIKVYTAGLYVPKKAGTPDELLDAPGPKRMTITMLRDIDANELGKLFTRGVEDNSPRTAMSQLIPGLLRMSQIFSERKNLHAGDSFTIDWLPARGTVISVNGLAQGEPIKEQAFFNALMRIWLGPSPADWKLKDDLLGKR